MKALWYKSVLLRERISTSLIMPKIILGATIGLFIFAASVGIATAMLMGITPVTISESLGISDTITATVIPGE